MGKEGQGQPEVWGTHHGQAYHDEDQHAGAEQRFLREVSAQSPDDQALDHLGTGRG